MGAIGLLLLVTPAAGAAPPQGPDVVEIAQDTISGWHLDAVTDVEWQPAGAGRPALPTVANVRCTASTNGLRFDTDRGGNARLSFPADFADGAGLFDAHVVSVRVDGVAYEARPVFTGARQWRFSNISYPGDVGSDIIAGGWTGYVAVRRRPRDPWIAAVGLLDRLLGARTVRIGYGPPTGKPREKTVSLRGFGQALLWCERQTKSDAAYRFVPGLRSSPDRP